MQAKAYFTHAIALVALVFTGVSDISGATSKEKRQTRLTKKRSNKAKRLYELARDGKTRRISYLFRRPLVAKKYQEAINDVTGDLNPLFAALDNNHINTAGLLLRHGATWNRVDALHKVEDINHRVASLHVAARKGYLDAARMMLEDGDANVDRRSDWGLTPLHFAAEYGHQAVAELLLAHAAKVNIKDGGGNTPLKRAREAKQTILMRLLKKHGA